MKVCISNPPYNLRWEHPVFAQVQERFSQTFLPPESNSNFAFILTALNECDKCVFILPNNVLNAGNKEEVEIRKYLVEKNYLEAVIACPQNMFEATSIPVCILCFNKKKDTTKIVMVNATDYCDKEVREQRGQFGGSAHENRVYKKEVNVFSDSQIEMIVSVIKNKVSEDNLSKCVTIEDVKSNEYNLSPTLYVTQNLDEEKTRSYEDISNDLNRIINYKNCLKLTINETLAKSLGLLDIVENMKESQKLSENMNEILGEIDIKIKKENFISLSKNKNEIKFENNSKEQISEILWLILNNWRQMIYHLNTEENRYLAELRDKLLNDLFSGKIDLDKV